MSKPPPLPARVFGVIVAVVIGAILFLLLVGSLTRLFEWALAWAI